MQCMCVLPTKLQRLRVLSVCWGGAEYGDYKNLKRSLLSFIRDADYERLNGYVTDSKAGDGRTMERTRQTFVRVMSKVQLIVVQLQQQRGDVELDPSKAWWTNLEAKAGVLLAFLALTTHADAGAGLRKALLGDGEAVACGTELNACVAVVGASAKQFYARFDAALNVDRFDGKLLAGFLGCAEHVHGVLERMEGTFEDVVRKTKESMLASVQDTVQVHFVDRIMTPFFNPTTSTRNDAGRNMWFGTLCQQYTTLLNCKEQLTAHLGMDSKVAGVKLYMGQQLRGLRDEAIRHINDTIPKTSDTAYNQITAAYECLNAFEAAFRAGEHDVSLAVQMREDVLGALQDKLINVLRVDVATFAAEAAVETVPLGVELAKAKEKGLAEADIAALAEKVSATLERHAGKMAKRLIALKYVSGRLPAFTQLVDAMVTQTLKLIKNGNEDGKALTKALIRHLRKHQYPTEEMQVNAAQLLEDFPGEKDAGFNDLERIDVYQVVNGTEENDDAMSIYSPPPAEDAARETWHACFPPPADAESKVRLMRKQLLERACQYKKDYDDVVDKGLNPPGKPPCDELEAYLEAVVHDSIALAQEWTAAPSPEKITKLIAYCFGWWTLESS